ncbi:MAG TPA: hypothetical protein VER36_10470 [Flavisolibacter sp.]|nr:hypothetical protein [Flavisolibacter sp.]
MKKIFFALALITVSSFAFAAPPVNEKVLKIFSAVFPDVQNAKWYENENNYEVYFDKEDMKCRIRYDFDGKVISTTRYYEEKSLCPFLRLKVSQKYPGKKIFGVTEVNTESELTYNIVLEDDKNWYHVSADAVGQLATTEK